MPNLALEVAALQKTEALVRKQSDKQAMARFMDFLHYQN
jgi:thioester reductase-like protein